MSDTPHLERYLTIKELMFELEKLGLPSSRTFIETHKQGAPFVCNRITLSDWLAHLKQKAPKK